MLLHSWVNQQVRGVFDDLLQSFHQNERFQLRLFEIFVLFSFRKGLALVDCCASSDTIPLLTQAVDLDCCIVMANKKPLTSTMVLNIFSNVLIPRKY